MTRLMRRSRFAGVAGMVAMIVAFLAVLEMVRLQAVVLVQKTLFAEILLRKHKMFDVVFTEDGNVSDSSQIDEQYS